MDEMQKLIQKVFDKYSFSQKEAEAMMKLILQNNVKESQLAAFLTAFRLKGEELPELTGMALVMRKLADKIKLKSKYSVDTCGTSGGFIDKFNVSTLAAFVAAGAGVTVAKQVNHSLSDNCGSADLLERMGVNIKLTPQQVKKCIDATGIGFLYGPAVLPKLEAILKTGRDIGIRNIFNVLLPLMNPAGASGQVVGVYNEKLTTLIAGVLRNLGVKIAYVVHGVEGIDEISITGETRISELRNGVINTFTVSPETFNLQSASVSAILGGTLAENAAMSKVVLSGKEHSPRTDIVLLNAAAAIAAGGKASNLHEGLALAQKSLYSGAAQKKLEAVIAFTNKSVGRKTKKKTKIIPKKKKR